MENKFWGRQYLVFMYRSPNSSNENSENFNITLKYLPDNFLSSLLVITQKLNGTIIPLKAMTRTLNL